MSNYGRQVVPSLVGRGLREDDDDDDDDDSDDDDIGKPRTWQ